jgi:hypothetical protein
MRRIHGSVSAVVAVVLGVLVIPGCGGAGGGSGPEGVAKQFFSSVKGGDYEKAVSYYQPSTLEEPGAKEKLIAVMKSRVEGKEGLASFEVKEATIEEDKASVPYVMHFKDGDQDDGEMTCVEEGGKWYLSLR